MSKNGRFGAFWASFEAQVMPEGCSEIQHREMKMAFYGGGAAAFAALVSILSPDLEPTEEDLQAVSEIQEEFSAFGAAALAAAVSRNKGRL